MRKGVGADPRHSAAINIQDWAECRAALPSTKRVLSKLTASSYHAPPLGLITLYLAIF